MIAPDFRPALLGYLSVLQVVRLPGLVHVTLRGENAAAVLASVLQANQAVEDARRQSLLRVPPRP